MRGYSDARSAVNKPYVSPKRGRVDSIAHDDRTPIKLNRQRSVDVVTEMIKTTAPLQSAQDRTLLVGKRSDELDGYRAVHLDQRHPHTLYRIYRRLELDNGSLLDPTLHGLLEPMDHESNVCEILYHLRTLGI